MVRGTFRSPIVLAAIVTTAATVVSNVLSNVSGVQYLCAQAKFVYGSGGTAVNVYVQTSLDGGATWVDIMNFNFLLATATKISAVVSTTALTPVTVPGDGALTANTVVSGLFGDRFRVKYVSTGTYAGNTSIQVDLVGKV